MTDRELLELAAKAAGVEANWRTATGCMCYSGSPYELAWNPLANDGDALRLAVALEIELRVFNGKAHAGRANQYWVTESCFAQGDKLPATRRAIVRAAAELGKAMP